MAKQTPPPIGVIYALLDTNALIPPRLSDVLFDCACKGLYLPRWTKKIEDEFVQNWGDVVTSTDKDARATRKASGIPPSQKHVAGARNRLSKYRAAVGGFDWEIVGYDDQDVIDRVPKEVNAGDVHLAAACLVMSDALFEEPVPHRVLLISSNIKHLAVPALGTLGVEVLRPGAFVDLLYQAQPSLVEESLCKTVDDLKDYSREELLSNLALHKADKTVAFLANKWRVKVPTKNAPSLGP